MPTAEGLAPDLAARISMVLQLVEQVRHGIAKSSPPSPASSGPGRLYVLRREIYAAVQRAFAQHRILPTGRGG